MYKAQPTWCRYGVAGKAHDARLDQVGTAGGGDGTSVDTCARNYDKFCTGKMYSQLKLFAFVLPHFKPGARKSNRFHTAPTRDLTIQHDAHEKRGKDSSL